MAHPIAADMPTKAPVYQSVVPIFSWSGVYVGLNAGGNWGTADASTTIGFIGDYFGSCGVPQCTDPFIAANRNQSFDTRGFTGGIQGGVNWQAGNIVGGIELDFQYFRSAGSLSVVAPFASSSVDTRTVNSSISTDWLFTARPRLGVAANNWLFYGTGGLAVTKLKADWSYSDSVDPTATERAAASATKVGWVAGGGVEVALPGNWLIGGEYLHVRFNGSVSGSGNIIRGGGAANDDVLNHTAGDLRSNIVRARLSYKFGTL